jgi:hypothetical protein
MRMMKLALWGGRGDGQANTGGSNLHTFADDGETSSSDQHPFWAFA